MLVGPSTATDFITFLGILTILSWFLVYLAAKIFVVSWNTALFLLFLLTTISLCIVVFSLCLFLPHYTFFSSFVLMLWLVSQIKLAPLAWSKAIKKQK